MQPMIFQAIFRNDVPAFLALVKERECLLEERSDEQQLSNTVLHLAAKLGHRELVSKIIELRPSLVRSRNADGDTPLHLAALLGDTNILLQMLESGHEGCSERNNKNQTPLHLASSSISMEAARLVAEKSESIDLDELDFALSIGPTCIAIAGIMLERFPNLAKEEAWVVEGSRSTLLHHACDREDVELTRILLGLEQGLEEALNNNGLSPLHLAILRGSVAILKEFLDKAPWSFKSPTSSKETVFHLAAKDKNIDAFIFMAESLKDSSELLHQTDENDNTVLHIAASTACLQLIRYIVDKKIVDISYKNKMGLAASELLHQEVGDFELITNLLRLDCTKETSEVLSLDYNRDSNGHSNEEVTEIVLRAADRESIGTPEPTKNQLNGDEEVQRLLRLIEKNTLVMVKSKKRSRRMAKDHKSLEYEMQIEALQNARNTITIVAVLIASVAFAGGINPPGGVNQDGPGRGKSAVGRTTPFKVFVICNNIALFTSLCIVILLVSIIPYKRKPLKRLLVVTNRMMWVAVGSMATAYVAASWVTIPLYAGTRWMFPAIISVAGGTMALLFSFLGIQTIGHWFRKKINQGGNTPSFALTSSDLAVSEHSGYFTY